MPGRVCIVTGGSSGIGRALCLAAAARGYRVVVVGRDTGRVAATRAMLCAGAEHAGIIADVTRESDMRAMAARCLERFQRIDLLVASAGIGRTEHAASRLPSPTTALSLSEWRGVLDVNLHGVFLANMAVLPAMREQGLGDIINMCSSTTPRGLRGRPFAQAYCASKFAVTAFTHALAEDLDGSGVRVGAVFPGPVRTPLIANTALADPFGGEIEDSHFAGAVLDLVDLPRDSSFPEPHILPVPRFEGASPRWADST